jgi:hypothetical protein
MTTGLEQVIAEETPPRSRLEGAWWQKIWWKISLIWE